MNLKHGFINPKKYPDIAVPRFKAASANTTLSSG